MNGSSTGKSFSGTPTGPQWSQWMIGIGGPQKRWREMHQSCSRYCTCGVARPLALSDATIRGPASRLGMPSNGPELTSAPSSETLGSGSPVRTTSRIGRPNWVANSKSRLSCAGTAMMAPVPYSIRT